MAEEAASERRAVSRKGQTRPLQDDEFSWSYIEVAVYGLLFIFWLTGSALMLAAATKRLGAEHGIAGTSHVSYFGMFEHTHDTSDLQWKGVREKLPLLIGAALTHVFVRKGIERVTYRGVSSHDPQLVLFYNRYQAVSGILLCMYIHRVQAVLLFAFVGIGYGITKIQSVGGGTVGRPISLICSWILSLVVLLWKHSLTEKFMGLLPIALRLNGFYPVSLAVNFATLRYLSYAYEKHWNNFSCDTVAKEANDEEEGGLALTRLDGDEEAYVVSSSRRDSKSSEQRVNRFAFINYLAYMVYPPLYLAGPIYTFIEWCATTNTGGSPTAEVVKQRRPFTAATNLATVTASPVEKDLRQEKTDDVAFPLGIPGYAIAWVLTLAGFEFFCGSIHVNAIVSYDANRTLWRYLTPLEMSAFSLFMLIFIWWKFVIIWRFFRLWALVDGSRPQENMTRVLVNNYSAFEFWRTWHASFNTWLVRYIYVPLGGNRRYSLRNVAVVFIFVALWHDVNVQLFCWASLMFLFIVPEAIARKFFNDPLKHHKFVRRHWKQVAVSCGAANVFLLVIANLVGFSFGMDGLSHLLIQGGSNPISFVFSICITFLCFFVAVQCMMFLRTCELPRKGNLLFI